MERRWGRGKRRFVVVFFVKPATAFVWIKDAHGLKFWAAIGLFCTSTTRRDFSSPVGAI